MPGSSLYDRPEAPAKKDWGELAQIGGLSLIVVVFFAIAAGSALSLLVSAIRH
jgi:hypothetical protein